MRRSLAPKRAQVLRIHQNQIIFADFLDTVANNPPYPLCVLHKVKFKLLVLVERIVKLCLMTLYNMETILF